MNCDFKQYVDSYENWPRPGVTFRDISPLMADWAARWTAITEMSLLALEYKPTVIVAVESRGFLFGTGIADTLRLPLHLVRKKGKVPGNPNKTEYDLEYGKDVLEMHQRRLIGQRVLIVDDVLATGGTIGAAARLVGMASGTVSAACTFIDLGLPGVLDSFGFPIHSLIQYGVTVQ